MRIIIVGAGKVGSELTRQLSARHRVTVIDRDPQIVDYIVNTCDVMGVCGNGASYEVQKTAEADKADLLIAAATSDEINILACLVAKKLGVSHTIARVRNPEYEEQLRFMREEMGLTMAINPERAAAHEIARVLRFHNRKGQAAEQRFKRIADAHFARSVAEVHAPVFTDFGHLCAGQIADGKGLRRVVGHGGCRRRGYGDIPLERVEDQYAGGKA